MPQQPEKKQKVDTQPSPSLLRRLMGQPMSESMQEQYPELAKAWANEEVRMPNETTAVNRVSAMGPITRWFGKAIGRESYGGYDPRYHTISLNMPLIERDKFDLEDLLTHELTHAKQKPGLTAGLRGLYTKPEDDPLEIEALAAERNRPRPHDIYLPPEKKKVKK